MGWLSNYEQRKKFTQKEAWKIYKIATWAEALGWTVLITGLLINHYSLPGKNIAIPIAGQIHGTLFIAYFVSVIAVYPSLEWKRINSLFALIAGIPPYGSLIFELYASRIQRVNELSNKSVSLYLSHKGNTIVMQPSKGLGWQLPTLNLKNNESTIEGANRLMKTFFDIKADPKLIPGHSSENHYIFMVDDPTPFFNIDLIQSAKRSPYVEEFAISDNDQFDINKLS